VDIALDGGHADLALVGNFAGGHQPLDGVIKLVGLSALMTTTVVAMEETIKLLHAEVPGVKIIVGGAVLTPEYAKQIGADYYAKDAAESARIAEEVFGQ